LNVLFISCAFYRSEVEYFTVLKTSKLFQTSPTEYMFNYTAKCFFFCVWPHTRSIFMALLSTFHAAW